MVFVIMFDTVKARNSINELIKINKKWSLVIRLIISPTAHISDNTQTHTTIKKTPTMKYLHLECTSCSPGWHMATSVCFTPGHLSLVVIPCTDKETTVLPLDTEL